MKSDFREAYDAGRAKAEGEFTREWSTLGIFAVSFVMVEVVDRFLIAHDALAGSVNFMLSCAVATPVLLGMFAVRRKLRK